MVKGYLSHLKRFLFDHSQLILEQVTSEVIRNYIVKWTTGSIGQPTGYSRGKTVDSVVGVVFRQF